MGTGDGSVQGLTTILNNGPNAARFNIVLVAEGFQASEESDFNDACDDFVVALQDEPWFGSLGSAINVHRLNVHSNQSGADDPSTCGDGSSGSGASPNTYFDATFCNSGIRRCLIGNETIVRNELNTALPEWHVAAVLVNTSQRGGCASNDVFWTALSTDWKDVVMHELGHAAFGLADEYNYWAGCGDDTDRDNAPVGEPVEINVTANTNRNTLKWRYLLSPGVPVPTMQNPDCSECDERPNVLLEDTAIGLYEGAKYYHCGRYRPAYTCKMRSSSQPFCRVCVEGIALTLADFITPDVALEVEPTTVNFGDVAFDMTMHRAVVIRNRRGSFPGQLRVDLTAPSAPFSFPSGVPTSFTLPAPVLEAATEETIFVGFTAPGSPGTSFGVFEASSLDDPGGSPVPVNLQGNAIEPPPVDTVLAIDRSGSMSEPASVASETKTDYAISAANLFVTLLKENDRIGIVRFNNQSDNSDVLLTMQVAGLEGSGAGRAAAWGVLTPANLVPSGSTSIGAGVINASNTLDAGAADARAIVVLTDGRQNTNPDIPAATAVVTSKSPRQRVFAVGLGLNQLEDRLHQIASFTDGVAQITGDLVDDREFLLQKLYVQILADIGDEAFVRDPSATLYPGQKRATTVFIGEVDVAADFVVVFRQHPAFPKYLNVWLEAPTGSLIRPGDVGVNSSFHRRPGNVFFRVTFPVVPGNAGTHAGRWRLWVENVSRHVVGTAAVAEAFGGALLSYATMVKARSDLRLGARLEQATYAPGAPMRLVLEPTLYGLPVGLDMPIAAAVRRPDLTYRTLSLSATAYGVYEGVFDDTNLTGPYAFSVEASATTPLGNRVTRFRHVTGLTFRRRHGDGGGQEDPQNEGWDRLEERLRRIEILLRECCKGKA